MVYVTREFSAVTPGRRLTDFEKRMQAGGAVEVSEPRKSSPTRARPGTVRLVESAARSGGCVKLIRPGAGPVKLISSGDR
jgi:hypothetical protein